MLDAILKRMKDDGESPRRRFDDELTRTLSNIKRKTDDLHNWHDKEDINGVKIWYNQQWVIKMFEEMEKAMVDQAATMKRMEKFQTDSIDVIRESGANTLILAKAIEALGKKTNG